MLNNFHTNNPIPQYSTKCLQFTVLHVTEPITTTGSTCPQPSIHLYSSALDFISTKNRQFNTFSLQTAEAWAPILCDIAASPGRDREAMWCGLHPQMLRSKERGGQDREEKLSQAGH